MTIPPQIIDNERIKLLDFIVGILKDSPNTNLDIATAFFNIKAFEMIKDYVKGIKRFRLLLGKAPEIKSDKTLGEELLRIIKEEVEGLELSKENEDNVKTFIEFLKKSNVEVRIYDKQFLHGKAFIFDKAVIIGSSNFTPAGLTHNTELNSVHLEAQAEYVRKNWFEKFWQEARDFKEELIELLEASRFGSKEYTPYEVFIKVLYELQKEDILEQEKMEEREGAISSKVELSEFQEDAVIRVKSRLKKYGGVIIADSVGLGKTWIAKKIIEEFGFYERKNFLVICPPQLRKMWSDEIKSIMLPANVMSLEELASEKFLEKANEITSGHLEDVELVIVDESHNLRNPLSNRWENFYNLVWEHIAKKGKRPYLIFLTATPINNTIWDLYWQIMLIVGMDRTAFIKEGISDLFKFFKEVDKRGDATLLNDLLNEISIRRTREYIKKNYPNATIKGKKITFPERILENIEYKLGETYRGMYKKIAKTIAEDLTMACYQLLKYKKVEKLSKEEEWELNGMIALSGILKTIFLKRLESSVEAFRISVRTHIHFLQKLKEYMKKGKLLTKSTFNKYIMCLDEEIEKFEDRLEKFNPNEYNIDELFSDIDKDIKILKEILKSVEEITPEKDAKLNVVKKKLLELSKKGQIILFTYYEDTLNYIWNQLQNSKEFKKLKIEKISGSTSTRERIRIEKDLLAKKIDILLSTDVLSEGTNLQSARIIVNYDLHWNPTRMLQRAGRIDRIGSPYKKIFVFNVFPEDELESLLKLVQILQTKITKIDEAIGLDQKILGEEIHPKVFGIIRKIRMCDTKILDELDEMAFGGGEKFYQPIKDFMKRRGLEELKRIEKIPYGIHSGLKKGIRGIFFYYKYSDLFHFWYLYDIENKKFITNKSEIIDFISCSPNEKRVIPEFSQKVYEINARVIQKIEENYKEFEQEQKVDTELVRIVKDKSSRFIRDVIKEVEICIDEHLIEHPDDQDVISLWDNARNKLLTISLTKKRLQILRKIWKKYKKTGDWKQLIREIWNFVKQLSSRKRTEIPQFEKNKLKLVAIDFIS